MSSLPTYPKFNCSGDAATCSALKDLVGALSSKPVADLEFGNVLNWPSASGWSDAVVGKPTSFCSFYGVACGSGGMITALNLTDNNLAGVLPASALALPDLTLLDLSVNAISGSLPASIASLSLLTSLTLQSNLFEGAIPVQMFSLQNVNSLTLSNNSFSGRLPSQVSLPALLFLDLSANALSGEVPITLPASLSGVTYLDFHSNVLYGSIPSAVSALTSVRMLSFANNTLNGTIPVELARLQHLATLDLSTNRISGLLNVTAYQAFMNPTLTTLRLDGNQLSGTRARLTNIAHAD